MNEIKEKRNLQFDLSNILQHSTTSTVFLPLLRVTRSEHSSFHERVLTPNEEVSSFAGLFHLLYFLPF